MGDISTENRVSTCCCDATRLPRGFIAFSSKLECKTLSQIDAVYTFMKYDERYDEIFDIIELEARKGQLPQVF